VIGRRLSWYVERERGEKQKDAAGEDTDKSGEDWRGSLIHSARTLEVIIGSSNEGIDRVSRFVHL